MFTVVESIVVVLPWTDKLPVSVKFANWTLSPVCNPVSTSVFAPFIVALTVPWLGELNVEPLITPSVFNFVFTLASV